MKILMVCLGNICRSPLAEGILKRKVKMNNLDWQVDSAGTGGWHVGALPDSRSIQVARKNGIDITDQRARKFQTSDLDQFDLIFAMDSSNYQNIVRHSVSDDQKEKVQLIMNMVQPGMNESVPDPYWDDNGFDQVFHMLEEACDQVIEKFRG
ncbi:MAG: low molecular weight phosphotyrosine protein phosphatase [Bacteroidetes bacterium]|jgi:protein-tyrosine phosphatase|nr:low molecular weight phosphotyrosine protein phosphatase [Bacteroidota bacterium]